MLREFVNSIEKNMDKQSEALENFIDALEAYNREFVDLEQRRIEILKEILVESEKNDRKMGEIESRLVRLNERVNVLLARPVYHQNLTDPK